MGELFFFVISFFSRWTRIVGLLAIFLDAVFLVRWINLLYIPRGMQDIDQPVICCAIVIIAICSLVFFIEPDSPDDDDTLLIHKHSRVAKPQKAIEPDRT